MLVQVTGFFVLESFVTRVTEDLLGPQETAQVRGGGKPVTVYMHAHVGITGMYMHTHVQLHA